MAESNLLSIKNNYLKFIYVRFVTTDLSIDFTYLNEIHVTIRSCRLLVLGRWSTMMQALVLLSLPVGRRSQALIDTHSSPSLAALHPTGIRSGFTSSLVYALLFIVLVFHVEDWNIRIISLL